MNNNNQTEHMGPLLQRIPDHEPPPRLWTRILETRIEEERRRRRGAVAAFAAAAAVALLAIVVPLMQAPGDDDVLRTLMARTQLLEERLLAYETRYASLDPLLQARLSEHQASLLAVDQALTTAYARGDSGPEVEALWRQRLDLMGAMVGAYETRSADAT